NEQMRVRAGQGTNVWTVIRGVGGTVPAFHAARKPVLLKSALDDIQALGSDVSDQIELSPTAITVNGNTTVFAGIDVAELGNAMNTQVGGQQADHYVINYGDLTTPYKLIRVNGHGPADTLDVNSKMVGTRFTLGAGVRGDVDLLVDLGVKRDTNASA